MHSTDFPALTQTAPGLPAEFAGRHIGSDEPDICQMLQTLGLSSLEELADHTVPPDIRLRRAMNLPAPLGEADALDRLRLIAADNKVLRSMIGMGYSDTLTPAVIQRNILENPGWYTQYTPYQAEIAQGRLEALLNFQTMIADLTALPLANASLLDEATAAAEAMTMCRAVGQNRPAFLVSRDCHPQTIAVVKARAAAQGIDCQVGDAMKIDFSAPNLAGVLVQYPTSDGRIVDYTDLAAEVHAAGAMLVVAADLLALTLLKPPGEFGADIAVGSAQRFGVPMGFGGPHAGFIATRNEFARRMPGRIVGVSKDVSGRVALRLAIQTREQHIRRERATSNICTAQVLLAIMAGMYAVYHGPAGLKRIAGRIHALAAALRVALAKVGYEMSSDPFFDTLHVLRGPRSGRELLKRAVERGINLRDFGDGTIGIALDETTSPADMQNLLASFQPEGSAPIAVLPESPAVDFGALKRTSPYLTHPVFNRYHSETEMLRYIFRLQSRDLSLAQSMIPLGSCTMKLNATSEMLPISWPEFAKLHPFAPADQSRGYQTMCQELESWLAEITGFAAVSLQPNAGSQGEYAGLMVIRAYLAAAGQSHRDICLIPASAHGTNPASAVTAGLRVVGVACDENGSIDLADLRTKGEQHRNDLAALMITYPSTHGVFEESVREVCQIVHAAGGQVYMDGANMNAQVGLCRPGDIGADVCHLNLHKTFCIPHGGGGPGAGPIAVAPHLAPFLPGHPVTHCGSPQSIGPVSAAPLGSAGILPIPWMYIAMMGPAGLKRATEVAILNANYMAQRLQPHYAVLFRGRGGRCAHEFIIDCRPFQASAGVTVEDIAKRLMDYGFHAPTTSWPVAGTLMIEPTESESKAELDRFCDALIAIRQEIASIEQGQLDRADNPLKGAPHTAAAVTADQWPHKYSREQAAYPAAWLKDYKFWPAVGRIDNPFGDRNLVCTCSPME